MPESITPEATALTDWHFLFFLAAERITTDAKLLFKYSVPICVIFTIYGSSPSLLIKTHQPIFALLLFPNSLVKGDKPEKNCCHRYFDVQYIITRDLAQLLALPSLT